MKAKARTPEEEKQLIDNLLIPCTTKEHFQAWLNIYLAVDLADFTVSRFSSTNPLDAAWSLYQYAVFNESDEPLKIMFVASRGSQKTLLLAATEVAVMLHDRRSVLHFAAIKEQSKVGFDYIKKFLQMPYVKHLLTTKPTIDEVKLAIPDINDPDDEPLEVGAKVLSISEGQVQGQHYSFVSVDELLVLQFGKRKAYEDIPGTLSADYRTGKPSIMAEISSRKGAFSLVEKKISEAPKTGLNVKSWTVLELTKACPDSRSGTEPVIYYSNPYLGVIQDEPKFQALPENEKKGYYKVDGFDGCIKCPIAPICCSDLKKQTSKSKALRAVQSVISEFKNNSIEWFLSQLMSMKPSSEGLIYGKYTRERHVKTAKEIWQMITGEEVAQKPTIHQIVDKLKSTGYRLYAGLDHTGGQANAAINVVAINKTGMIFVLEGFAQPKLDIEDVAIELTRLKSIFEFEIIFADPAAADKNQWLAKKKKFRIKDSFDRSIDAGIEILRSKLMAGSGDITIYLLDERTATIQDEFSKYHYKENSDGTYSNVPEDEFNHNLDAMRYILINIFARHGNVMAPELSKEEEKQMKNDMVGDQDITVWLQATIQDAIQKNAAEKGVDVDPIMEGDGDVKWIF